MVESRQEEAREKKVERKRRNYERKMRNEVCRRKLIQLEVVLLETLYQFINEDSLQKKSALDVGRKDEWKGIEQRVRQKWDCSHIEDSVEEGDVMDWYEDHEMRTHWEDLSKEEGRIVTRKTEGNGLQIEGAQRVPELMAFQFLIQEKELKKKDRKGKGGGLVHGEDGRKSKQPVE